MKWLDNPLPRSKVLSSGYDIHSLPWYRWPIEIDSLPFLKMGGFSIAMLNNQMVSFFSHQKWSIIRSTPIFFGALPSICAAFLVFLSSPLPLSKNAMSC